MKTEAEVVEAIRRYADSVRRICFLHLTKHSDIEDVFGTVFWKYALCSDTHTDPGIEKLWILRACIREYRAVLDGFFVRKLTSLEDMEPESLPAAGADRAALDAILRLPDRDRDIIYLDRCEGCSTLDIAHILGKKEAEVTARLTSAKTTLEHAPENGERTGPSVDIRAALDGIRAEEALITAAMEKLRRRIYRKKNRLPVGALAVCLAILTATVLIGLSQLHRWYYTETAYIALDAVPSIGLAVNRYDRVIEVCPYNTEGRKIATGLTLLHTPYSEAVPTLLNAFARQGYLEDEDSLLTLSLQADSSTHEAALLGALRSDIDRFLSDRPIKPRAEYLRVDSEVKTHALTLGLSPAKYLAIAELRAADPSATVAEYRNQSIRAIRQRLRLLSGETDSADTSAG